MNRYLIALHATCWLTIAGIVAAHLWWTMPFWPALFAVLAIRVVDMEYTMVIKSEIQEETTS